MCFLWKLLMFPLTFYSFFLPFLKGEKNRQQSAVQLVILFCLSVSSPCVSVWQTGKKCVEFDAWYFSQHSSTHEYIHYAARCWCEVLGAGVCVCTCVAGKKRVWKGLEASRLHSTKTNKSFVHKIIPYAPPFLKKSTCSSRCMWVWEN